MHSDMKLSYFTNDEEFPFYIGYGTHENEMFMHGHADFSELVIVLDGSAVHIVDDERFNIRKGDVFVMGNGICHGYDSAENFKICNVMFRSENLLSGDYDIKQLPGFHALFLLEQHFNTAQGFKSRLRLEPESFDMISRLIDTTISEYTGKSPGRKTILQSYFMQIVVELSRIYVTAKKHKEIDGISGAAAYMERHYAEDISIDSLLKVSHYSQRHFIRLFEKNYNTTPQKYLLGIRMRRACVLLRDSDSSITQIATNCGFNDASYFSRIFKKYTNFTPNQYRRTMS